MDQIFLIERYSLFDSKPDHVVVYDGTPEGAIVQAQALANANCVTVVVVQAKRTFKPEVAKPGEGDE